MGTAVHVGRAMSRRRIPGLTRLAMQLSLTLACALVVGLLMPFIASQGVLVVAPAVGLLALSAALARGAAVVVTGIFALALLSLPWNAVRLTDWMTVSDAMLVAGSLSLLALAHRARPHALRGTYPLIVGVLLMGIGGLIGSSAATDLVTGFANMVRFGVAALAVPIVLAWWSPNRRAVQLVIWTWVLGASVSAIVAILQLQGGDYTRPLGLGTHPNTLAITSLMASGPALYLVAAGRLRTRLLALGLVASLFFAVVISGSRAGILGYLGVVAVFTLLSRRTVLALLGMGALAGGVLANVLALSTENAVSRLFALDPGTVSQSNLGRLATLEDNFNSALAHPLFGIGFELAGDAHNIFLQVFVSAGIVGLGGFLYLIYGVISGARRSIAKASETNGRESRLLVIGLAASFVGYLVAGLFQNALWDRYIWIVPGLLAAVAPVCSEIPALNRFGDARRVSAQAGFRELKLGGPTE